MLQKVVTIQKSAVTTKAISSVFGVAFALLIGMVNISQASTMTFTDHATFLAALPGPASILDFDSLAAGTLLSSGTTTDGVTFTYDIAGETMKIVDAFDTTSPGNSLGLTGGDDAFLDGDAFDLGFDQEVNALGMFFITSDPALAGEIQLSASVGTALNAGTESFILSDGGSGYFVGLISTDSFSTASIGFAADGEINFAYNVDDITTAAVPEPSTFLLLGTGVLGLIAYRRKRHAANTTQ